MREVVRQLGALAVVVLAAVVLGAGCGGGGDESSTAAAVTENPSMTKAKFQQKAIEVCEEGKAEFVTKLAQRAKELGKANPEEINGTEPAEVLVASLNKQLASIRELGSPPGDLEKILAFEEAFQQVIGEMEEEQPEGTKEFHPILKQVDKSANAYGVHACAYGE